MASLRPKKIVNYKGGGFPIKRRELLEMEVSDRLETHLRAIGEPRSTKDLIQHLWSTYPGMKKFAANNDFRTRKYTLNALNRADHISRHPMCPTKNALQWVFYPGHPRKRAKAILKGPCQGCEEHPGGEMRNTKDDTIPDAEASEEQDDDAMMEPKDSPADPALPALEDWSIGIPASTEFFSDSWTGSPAAGLPMDLAPEWELPIPATAASPPGLAAMEVDHSDWLANGMPLADINDLLNGLDSDPYMNDGGGPFTSEDVPDGLPTVEATGTVPASMEPGAQTCPTDNMDSLLIRAGELEFPTDKLNLALVLLQSHLKN